MRLLLSQLTAQQQITGVGPEHKEQWRPASTHTQSSKQRCKELVSSSLLMLTRLLLPACVPFEAQQVCRCSQPASHERSTQARRWSLLKKASCEPTLAGSSRVTKGAHASRSNSVEPGISLSRQRAPFAVTSRMPPVPALSCVQAAELVGKSCSTSSRGWMRSLPGPGGSSQSCSNVPWLCIVCRKRPHCRAASGTARLLMSAPPGPYGGTSRPACVSLRTCACQKAAGSASTALLQALRRCEECELGVCLSEL